MVFLLLSFQYQFKDKYFDAANLRLPLGVPLAKRVRAVAVGSCCARAQKGEPKEAVISSFCLGVRIRLLRW